MQLTKNELTYTLEYASEDTPKEFDLRDWGYLVPVITVLSPKITFMQQQGIYGDEPRRFALTVSEELTEQEITDILTAWTNFDATSAKTAEKKIATEKLRQELGRDVSAYLGYLCEEANLTMVDYGSMLDDATLTLVDRLLSKGALESCKAVLMTYVPTSYFPVEMATAIINKLTECIAEVDAFIAS